jgi:hypothetical protein
MLTAEDVEFEPPSPKVHFLTSSIAVMYSGDADLYAEIIQDLAIDVNHRIQKDPDRWLNVKEVVDLYVNYWNTAKLRRSEAAILAPLNLDNSTFLSLQKSMNDDLVVSIADELIQFSMPKLEVIIAGIDLRVRPRSS